ncbi:hypothetical protein BJ165DRAFT_1514367, partial [Panaeolus papilionaceus]
MDIWGAYGVSAPSHSILSHVHSALSFTSVCFLGLHLTHCHTSPLNFAIAFHNFTLTSHH